MFGIEMKLLNYTDGSECVENTSRNIVLEWYKVLG